MDHLHYEFNLNASDSVKVSLAKQANIRLMDSTNYQYYKSGRAHQFYGGLAKTSPFIVNPPHAGKWHIAIDLGGYSGRISATVNII